MTKEELEKNIKSELDLIHHYVDSIIAKKDFNTPTDHRLDLLKISCAELYDYASKYDNTFNKNKGE